MICLFVWEYCCLFLYFMQRNNKKNTTFSIKQFCLCLLSAGVHVTPSWPRPRRVSPWSHVLRRLLSLVHCCSDLWPVLGPTWAKTSCELWAPPTPGTGSLFIPFWLWKLFPRRGTNESVSDPASLIMLALLCFPANVVNWMKRRWFLCGITACPAWRKQCSHFLRVFSPPQSQRLWRCSGKLSSHCWWVI